MGISYINMYTNLIAWFPDLSFPLSWQEWEASTICNNFIESFLSIIYEILKVSMCYW